MSDPDVLIVGAGPSGLMLALCFTHEDISFKLIDQAASPSPYSRALVLHSRTLELLARYGIVDRFIERGRFNNAMRVFANRKMVIEVDLLDASYGDTRFPTPLMISQAEIEHLLIEALRERGKEVDRLLNVTRLEQNTQGAMACLQNEHGDKEEVRCKYIVGCDGAHSVVRKSAGLAFEGAPYPQDFILADVRIKWNGRNCLSTFMGAHGFIVLIPIKDDIMRIVCTRPDKLDSDAEPKMIDFEEAFRHLVSEEAQLSDPTWMSRFRLHHRVAEKFRSGRFFLAGDSAHIHSPAGGQGMNTGMQDSINLAWKLASVIRREQNEALLDTYNIERRRVAEHLLAGTDRLFEYMATVNPLILLLRNTLLPWVLPVVMRNRYCRMSRFRFVSQLGIRYRHSPIVKTGEGYGGNLRGGDRAPDGRLKGTKQETTLHEACGTSHDLFLFAGTGARDEKEIDSIERSFLDLKKDWIQIHKVMEGHSSREKYYVDPNARLHMLYGFNKAGYVLLRPDGYIACIGLLASFEELKSWIRGGMSLADPS